MAHRWGWGAILLVVATLASPVAGQDTAATGDTSAGFVRTGLHDKIEEAGLVVHAEVTASGGVSVGKRRRWVQTLEVLEVFHEDHDRAALAVGDSISFFTWYDDSVPSVAPELMGAARMPIGGEAVYFLDPYSYTESAGASVAVWRAVLPPDPRTPDGRIYDSMVRQELSVVAALDYGGTTGVVAGRGPVGLALVLDKADAFEWITFPFEKPVPSLGAMRIDPATAAADAMPWATFLTRVRSASGEL
ncbi:MAG: hypothetical protein KTR31_08505 [Myxococcales bacterium]|nr:hypothetical protein [Myxococcales bacterium]